MDERVRSPSDIRTKSLVCVTSRFDDRDILKRNPGGSTEGVGKEDRLDVDSLNFTLHPYDSLIPSDRSSPFGHLSYLRAGLTSKSFSL